VSLAAQAWMFGYASFLQWIARPGYAWVTGWWDLIGCLSSDGQKWSIVSHKPE